MSLRQAFGRGGVAAAACTACCAPVIIGALGLAAGLAVTAALVVGVGLAIAVALVGTGWIVARLGRPHPPAEAGPVPMAAPTLRSP